jgi:hypothetical protein
MPQLMMIAEPGKAIQGLCGRSAGCEMA